MKRNSLRATERRNPRTRGLDKQSTPAIVRALSREDAAVAGAVARAQRSIARAVDVAVHAIEAGGRLLYVGAGTSGRLAALDAAEIPPTFGTPAHMVQALIAGGRAALTRAVEGAEDDREQGARDVAARRVNRADAVVGITASGATPYVLGALALARSRGAATVGITCNRGTPLARLAQITIVTETGPEAIAGSTRLKAGTAQKMVLNMISTATMVRLGRIYDNWMLGVALTNDKLRARGVRILAEASGATPAAAKRALRESRNRLPVALLMLAAKLGRREAERVLRAAGGNLRAAMGKATKGLRKQNG